MVSDSRHRTEEEDSKINVKNAWGDEIPIMLNWAAEYMRFETVQFNITECYWRYASTQAPTNKDESVQWYHPEEEQHLRIFPLRNCTVDPNYTWSPPEMKTEKPEECQSLVGEISGSVTNRAYPWLLLPLLGFLAVPPL